MSSHKHHHDPLFYPLHQYPIVFIDYLWVITMYISLSFSLAVIIDGYILPPFDYEIESKQSSLYLASKVLFQFAVQGFIAIFLNALLQRIPSPVHGFFGYDATTRLGILVRNPAIISVTLFALSMSLRQRLLYLFGRFNHNATLSIPPPKLPHPST